jgi:hypothetical protein
MTSKKDMVREISELKKKLHSQESILETPDKKQNLDTLRGCNFCGGTSPKSDYLCWTCYCKAKDEWERNLKEDKLSHHRVIYEQGRQAKQKEILEKFDKHLELWYHKWMRKIVTGRCLAELKELKSKIKGEKLK